ncbi:MAG: hypothetical protein IJC48_12265 [Clostridia bacterium]|nr:hypothetical protein [Clostridia bacterium]
MNKRMKIALIAVLASLVLFALAAAMLAGAGNGYERMFEALEKYLFETKNVTVETEITTTIGQKPANSTRTIEETDGSDSYKRTWEYENGTETLTESYMINGDYYHSFDHEKKTYHVYSSKTGSSSYEADAAKEEEEERLAMRLLKLFADFLSGDIKNQFSHTRIEGGDHYTVTVSKEQLPEFASIFIDIFNLEASETNSYPGRMEFEDKEAAFRLFYQEKTGKELDSDFFDIYSQNPNVINAYWKMHDEMIDEYEQKAEPLGEHTFIYVSKDGSMKTYENKAAWLASIPFTEETIAKYGLTTFLKTLSYQSATAEIEIHESGEFKSITYFAEFEAADYSGNTRPLIFEGSIRFTNYGSTAVRKPNLAGYKQINGFILQENDFIKTIEFDGKTYEITYTEEASR